MLKVVTDGKYNEFRDAQVQTLKHKTREHPQIQEYLTRTRSAQMKMDKFKEIREL